MLLAEFKVPGASMWFAYKSKRLYWPTKNVPEYGRAKLCLAYSVTLA